MSEQSVVRPLAFAPGVYQENRDERSHASVVLSFEASAGELRFEGLSFSLSGFRVRAGERSQQEGEVHHRNWDLGIGDKRDFRLRIELAGFVCEIKAVAVCTERAASESGDILVFKFIAIDSASQEALRRIVRSYLSGFIPSPNDIAVGADQPTMRSGDSKGGQAPASRSRRYRNALGLAASLCLLIGAVGFAGISLYERLFTVKSSFATVTAPKIDILSPAVGQVRTPIAGVGQEVDRDQLLFDITSEGLEADIEYAEARLAYYEASSTSAPGGTAKTRIEDAAVDTALITGSLPPSLATPGTTQTPSGGTAAMPVATGDFAREADLAQGLLKSLRLRRSNLTEHSPCECLVSWSQEDGAWVKEGDLVMTLARTGEENLRVEALVNLKFADQLRRGQSAIVELAESGETLPAVVEQITLDPTRQPRVGFPEWLRREPTLASVVLSTERPLDAGLIGTPVKVTLGEPVTVPWEIADIWRNVTQSAIAAE